MFAIVWLLFARWLPLEPLRYGFGEIRFVDDVVPVNESAERRFGSRARSLPTPARPAA